MVIMGVCNQNMCQAPARQSPFQGFNVGGIGGTRIDQRHLATAPDNIGSGPTKSERARIGGQDPGNHGADLDRLAYGRSKTTVKC